MPQDIPLEASETLVFTPDSLRDTDAPPSFTLRTATWREKRALRKLAESEGVERHGLDAMREETRRGLRLNWDAAAFERHMPQIEAWWDAHDALARAVADWEKRYPSEAEREANPRPQLEFDPDLDAAIVDLLARVEKAHKPLAAMKADNSDYNEMIFPLLIAVMVRDWTGLEISREIEDGYLTLGCAIAISEALTALGVRANVGAAPFLELGVACSRRMNLDEDEAKNSASPSQSETPPGSSTTASAGPGPSPELTSPPVSPKRSPKTPQPA